MLRRTLLSCCALAPRDMQRVNAWFVHAPLNLDKLENQLRAAHLPSVRRLTPTTGGGGKLTSRTAPRDDLLIFSIDPNNMGSVTGLPMLDAIRQPSAECHGDAKKSFFVFRDGAIVGWNAGSRDMSAVMRETLDTKPSAAPVCETLKFSTVGHDEEAARGDTAEMITVGGADESLKLPFSYALAQSLKIEVVDGHLRPILIDAKRWQKELARSGHMPCPLRSLRMAKARLLAVTDDMDFGADIQTTPKVFWMPEHQQLRNVYKSARAHLEIDGRLEVLEDRAATVNEALDYLSGEVHTETNEFLTWVIIVLIGIEILLALLHNDVVTALAASYMYGLPKDAAAAPATATSALPPAAGEGGSDAATTKEEVASPAVAVATQC